jgi:hypothetical protein
MSESIQSTGTFYTQLSPVEDYDIYIPIIRSESLGNVSGKVIRADNGQGLVGAQVCLSGGTCVATGAYGIYQIDTVLSGLREFSASASEYISVTESVEVLPNQSSTLDFALSRDLNILGIEKRIVLTWDPTPEFTTPNGTFQNDMDAHLWMNLIGSVYHIYYDHRGDCTTFPSACLKYDVMQGFGPETVDIMELQNAVYHYGVYEVNYHFDPVNLPPITELDAVVRIYSLDGESLTYHVPDSGAGNFWYVFALAPSGQITPTNCILNFDPGDTPPSCP